MAGELSRAEASERVAELHNAPVTTTPVEDDLAAALELASRLRHPVYDCVYVAAALRENSFVATADRRFQTVTGAVPAFAGAVRLVGAKP